MNKLAIRNVSKTYSNGVRALNNISLEIENGMFGLLGPNGSGKSSLMRTIAGLQKPDEGTIIFNETDIVAASRFIKKQLGFLPQQFGVYPKVTAFDLLTHIAILKGVSDKKERKEQVLSLLEKVNLFQHRKKEAHTFSGGMLQRFGIAQALLGHPKIVIVDEPTAGLDPEERNRFNNLLSEIGEEIIVILSTHLVEDVRNLCTNMAIVDHGSILAQGKPQDFLAELKGKLWQRTIHRKEQAEFAKGFHVISSHLVAGQLNIHVLDSEQPKGFSPVSPSLEDVYFSTLHKKQLSA
jgi:ABC-2 type transport system ATP-binding protein